MSKSGLKMRLERFKSQKFSYPGEGDTPSPGPHPPQPRPCGPRRVSSALRASLKVAAATCPPKFQVPSHFFILRRPDIYIGGQMGGNGPQITDIAMSVIWGAAPLLVCRSPVWILLFAPVYLSLLCILCSLINILKKGWKWNGKL